MRTKVISAEEREASLKVWQSPFQVGRKVVIKQEPRKAGKNGFLYGTIHRIVEPPKKHRNSQMEVFLLSKTGEVVGLSYPHWQILPKGAKFTPEQYELNHSRTEQAIGLPRQKMLPIVTPVPVSEERVKPKRIREAIIEEPPKRLRSR